MFSMTRARVSGQQNTGSIGRVSAHRDAGSTGPFAMVGSAKALGRTRNPLVAITAGEIETGRCLFDGCLI